MARSDKREAARSAVSELDLIGPRSRTPNGTNGASSTATTESPPKPDERAVEAEEVRELNQAVNSVKSEAERSGGEASKPRRRRRRSEAEIGVEIYLPESMLYRARSLVRPLRTGSRRSLGAAFVIQAYARAVDELVAEDLDVAGIGPEDGDELVDRIKRALAG